MFSFTSYLISIFPTQESNPGLPHCRCLLYHLSHQGSPWQANALRTMCPSVGKIVRAFTAIVQRRHYQMVNLLLMGW